MVHKSQKVIPIQFQEQMVAEIEGYLGDGLYSSKAEFIREAVRDKLIELRKKLFWERTEEIKQELKKRGVHIKTPFLTRKQKDEAFKSLERKLKVAKGHRL